MLIARTIVACAALLMAAMETPAQLNPPLGGGAPQQGGNPLVGTWTTQTTRTDGTVTSTIFTTFLADGRFSQRRVIPGSTVDYVGNYQLSPDRNAVQSIYRDYNPKQDCRYGACYPIMPMVQMNTPMTIDIRWVRDNLFMTQDASGPMRWIRQQ
jgi:hypothetical protein